MELEQTNLRYLDKIRLISRDARLTIAVWMFYAFALGIHDVIFNLYLIEAGFTEDFLGFFLSISMFLVGFLAIPAGVIADRTSRKRILMGSAIINVIAYFIQYSILSPSLLLFSQILFGLSSGFIGVCWQPYTISVTTEQERVHVFSVRFAFFLVANLLGSLIGGFLPSLWLGLGFATSLLQAYKYSLWIALIPNVLSALFFIPMTVDRPEPSQSEIIKRESRISYFGKYFHNIRNRRFIGKYATAWTISGLGAGLFVHFFNIFFSSAFGIDSATIGVIFAVYTLVVAVGNFVSPVIVDRFGKFGTIIWFQILSIPFLAILSWSPLLYIAVIGFIGRGLAMNIAWPVMDVFYLEGLEKEEQSTAMGVINTGDSLSRAIGVNIGGVMLATGFLRAPFALAIVFYVASIILFYWFFTSNEDDYKNELEVVNNGKED
ncbi:MAG: MFS transporter [Candidatus Thorarchaeota archaeon]